MTCNSKPRSIESIFSDETANFRIPYQPKTNDKVKVLLRVLKEDTPKIYFVSNVFDDILLTEEKKDQHFTYYAANFVVSDNTPVVYHFQIEYADQTIYYNKLGCTWELNTDYDFRIVPDYYVPEWMQGAVTYQIFVDRFCNGNKDNDVQTAEYAYINKQVQKIEDWDTLPDEMDVRNFYGGDLIGVESKLDYFKYLGIEVIYFNPLFVSPSNHKYDSQDYDYIDPHLAKIVTDGGKLLGEDVLDNRKATKYICRTTKQENLEASNAYFAGLVGKLHDCGMKVILDGVFNHCGSFHRWLDAERIYEKAEGALPGAYITKKSPYHTYFSFLEDGTWPYNDHFDGWWGMETLPKLNYEESPKLVQDIFRIGRKWVSAPYCVDGWRLDVAADLGHTQEYNHAFWKAFRKEVRNANEEAVILAEHYGDPTPWLTGNEWDTVMNYDAFMEPVSWFLTGMDKHSDTYDGGRKGNGDWFIKTMVHQMSKFMGPSLLAAMNELSNHDHSRFMTRTNNTVGRLKTRGSEAAGRGIKPEIYRMAVVMQMTWPGAPTIYYGDETGVVGWTDPDNRRTYPWGHQNWELIEFHRYAIKIHNEISSLKRGSLILFEGSDGIVSYGRFDDKNCAVTIVNASDVSKTVFVPVWRMGIWETNKNAMCRVLMTMNRTYSIGKEYYDVIDGYTAVDMPPYSSCVLVRGEYDYQ